MPKSVFTPMKIGADIIPSSTGYREYILPVSLLTKIFSMPRFLNSLSKFDKSMRPCCAMFIAVKFVGRESVVGKKANVDMLMRNENTERIIAIFMWVLYRVGGAPRCIEFSNDG